MKKIYFPLLFLTTVFSSYAQEKLTTSYDLSTIESKAIQYQENNQIEKAIAEYAKVDELDTAYFEAQYQIISLLLKLEKTEAAEEVCKKLIDQYDKELPSIYFLTYATIKSDQKNYDEALFYLEKSKNKGSLNVITKYNEALVYYKIDEKQKALDLLKEVVTLAPTYGQAYYLLGIIAIEDGKASIGLLSLLTYLSIYPGTEAAAQSLNQLNRNLAEIYTLTPELKYSEGGDDFSELDLILKNNLAQHKDYPLKLDIDNRISRVIQAILEYMNEHQVQGGFFENKYSPWMKAIVQRNLISPYTYISMSLYEDSYKKQYKKNAKIISNYAANELYLNIYPKLYKAILEGQIFTISNLDTGYFYYQGDDGNLNGLAMQFSQNYYKESEGFFSNNQLDGELKRYNPNGILTSRSHYKEDEINGLVTTYYSTGKVYLEESMKGDLSDGPTTIYYPISTKKGGFNLQRRPTYKRSFLFFPYRTTRI